MSLFAFQDIVTSVTGILLLIAMAMAIQVARSPAREPDEVTQAEQRRLEAKLAAVQTESEALASRASESESLLSAAADTAPGASDEERAAMAREIERLMTEVAGLEANLQRSVELQKKREAKRAEANQAELLAETTARLDEATAALRGLAGSNRVLFNVPPRLSGRVMLVELFPGRVLIARAGVAQRPTVIEGPTSTEDTIDFIRESLASDWILFAHPGTTDALARLRSDLGRLDKRVGFDLLPDSVTVVDSLNGAP